MSGFSSVFRGITGQFESTRMIGVSAAVVFPLPYLYDCFRHGIIPEPAAFGQGYALVLGAIGLMIGGKDFATGKGAAALASTAPLPVGDQG